MNRILCELVDVDVEVFASFNKLRRLTTDMGLVAKALSTSQLLEVSDLGQRSHVERTV